MLLYKANYGKKTLIDFQDTFNYVLTDTLKENIKRHLSAIQYQFNILLKVLLLLFYRIIPTV